MSKLYSALLHTHELLVTLYVLLFTIKLVLMLLNNDMALVNFRKRTKVIGEMILPTLFLISGAYLATVAHSWGDTWFLLKFALIIVTVLTGIFTFKNNSKILGIFTFLIFIYIILLSYRKNPELKKPDNKPANTTETVVTDPNAPSYNMVKHGLYLYGKNGCASCHGNKGDLGDRGAANLVASTLDDNATETVIRDGRGPVMAAYGTKISMADIHVLGQYVKSLRKK
jgi:mono/diheme cytochrome c family protein